MTSPWTRRVSVLARAGAQRRVRARAPTAHCARLEMPPISHCQPPPNNNPPPQKKARRRSRRCRRPPTSSPPRSPPSKQQESLLLGLSRRARAALLLLLPYNGSGAEGRKREGARPGRCPKRGWVWLAAQFSLYPAAAAASLGVRAWGTAKFLGPSLLGRGFSAGNPVLLLAAV